MRQKIKSHGSIKALSMFLFWGVVVFSALIKLFADISLGRERRMSLRTYLRPAGLIALPLRALPRRDPLEITIQCHFPARAAQRPVGGTLVTENYQLAQMKWLLERPLKTHHPLSPSQLLSLPHCLPLHLIPSLWEVRLLKKKKKSMKCISRSHSFASSSFRPACFATAWR